MTKISVVVPTHQRPELLKRCLRAIAQQNFAPADFEIIVADNAGETRTRHTVADFAANSAVNVRCVFAANRPGPAAARNVGWLAATGEVIAFTDDDCLPDANWLAEGWQIFAADAETAAVAGKVEMPLPAPPTDYELNEAGLTTAEFVTANCFVRRSVLTILGGFDERFAAAWREDSDLHFRLLENNLKIAAAPRAIVVHPIRPARFGVSLWQQRKSMFDALLYRKHPQLFLEKISFSPLEFYVIVLALNAGIAAAATEHQTAARLAGAVWLILTARFCVKRLRRTSRQPRHVFEMIVTSALIPPVAVFWRLRGAFKFRIFFL